MGSRYRTTRVPFRIEEALRKETFATLSETLRNLRKLKDRTNDPASLELIALAIQGVETAIDCIRD